MRRKTILLLLTGCLFFVITLCLAGEPKTVTTITECALYDRPEGKDVAWVNQGYAFSVLKQEENWYLVKTSFGKITEAWIKAADVRVQGPDENDIDIDEWKDVPVLIRDKEGDVTNPNSCDVTSIKQQIDDDEAVFLLEMAVGWEELFERTKSTGSIGAIYLDVDKNRTTGFDGGIIYVRADGSEERRIDPEDPRIGTEYQIQVNTGFRMKIEQDGVSSQRPSISYQLLKWDNTKNDWQLLDHGPAFFAGPLVQVTIQRKVLILPQDNLGDILFEEWNALGDGEYTRGRM